MRKGAVIAFTAWFFHPWQENTRSKTLNCVITAILPCSMPFPSNCEFILLGHILSMLVANT